MRNMLILLAMSVSAMATAQVPSSANLSCTVIRGGAMKCGGISVPDKKEAKNTPTLFVTHFMLEPGATVERPSSVSDCLIVGIDGGSLLNEKEPYLHVSLEKDEITLMPKEQAFRLRNERLGNVEFRLIEIRR